MFPIVPDAFSPARFLAAYAFASYNSEALSPPPDPRVNEFTIFVADVRPSTNPARFEVEFDPRSGEFLAQGRAEDEILGGGIPGSNLRILANIVSPGVSNPDLRFRYSSYALWTETAGFETFINSYLFGFATPATALPPSGSRMLAGVIRGELISARIGTSPNKTRLTGSATVAVNFGTGQVRVQMNLNDPALSFDNSFTLATNSLGSSRFAGTLTGAGGATMGKVTGGAYGPAGEEIALTFTLSRSIPGLQEEQRIVGVVLAK